MASQKRTQYNLSCFDLLSAALLPTYTHVTEKQDTHTLVSIHGHPSAETYSEPVTGQSDPEGHDAAVGCRPPDLPRAHSSHPGVVPAGSRWAEIPIPGRGRSRLDWGWETDAWDRVKPPAVEMSEKEGMDEKFEVEPLVVYLFIPPGSDAAFYRVGLDDRSCFWEILVESFMVEPPRISMMA